jgi:hypothetical protein
VRRPGKRELERALRTAAPEPPPELGRKLVAAIPEDLFAPRAEHGVSEVGGPAPVDAGGAASAEAARPVQGPSRRRRTSGPALAIAASLLVVVGAGWLATRLYQEGTGPAGEAPLAVRASADPEPLLETTAPPATSAGDAPSPRRRAAAEVAPDSRPADAPQAASAVGEETAEAAAPPPVTNPTPRDAIARLDDLAEPGERPADGDRERRTPGDVAPTAPAGAVLDAVSSDRRAPAATEELAAASTRQEHRDSQRSAEPEEPTESEALAGQSTGRERSAAESIATGQARLESEVRRLRAASVRDARTDPLAVTAPRRTAPDRADEPSSFFDASERALSTLTVEASEARLLQKADAGVSAAPDVAPLANLLDDVARSRVAAAGPVVAAETVAGPPAAGASRVYVFVSAIVTERGRGGAAGVLDTLELELDPAVAPRYRLLESEARPVDDGAPAGAGAGSRARQNAGAAPLFRLSALYELERADGAGAAARLGVVRVRAERPEPVESRPAQAELDRATTGGGERVLDVWTPVRAWASTHLELRLAVLSAQLQDLQAGGSSASIEAIQEEIARVEREAMAGSSVAEGAARLRTLAAAAATAGAPAEPAAPTAPGPRPDG